jgi:hypothetical protein
MPESEKRKENSSEGQPQRTEFARFKALASSLLKVPKEELEPPAKPSPDAAEKKSNEG